MEKKKKSRKKVEEPMEAKEKVERVMATQMSPHCSERETHDALEECETDVADATRRLCNQGRKKNGEAEEKGGGEEREGRGANGAKGESRAFPDCPSQLTKHSGNVTWTPSAAFINLLEKEKGKTRTGVPAEYKEQVEHLKETVKEVEPEFTEEEIYEILKQCKMDPNLATERLLANSLEEFEEVKTKRKKKKVRSDAQESKFQQKGHSSSSSSIAKQGGSRHDDTGRMDTTHDDAVPGIQEADSNSRSQLDNVSAPPGATVSPAASQSNHLNIGKTPKLVRSTDDNTAVVSRSHVPPLHAMGPLGIHGSKAGSNFRASRNNVAYSSRYDSGKFHSVLGRSSTKRNGHLNGSEVNEERSIRGPRTCATLPMLSKPEEQEIPHVACEALADSYDPNSSCLSEATPSNSVTSFSHPLKDPQDTLLDSPFVPARYSTIEHQDIMSEHALTEAGLSNSLRRSIQSIGNASPDLPFSAFDHMTYSSMEGPAIISMNAPAFTPSASIHQSSQTLLQGNNLSSGRGFTHPYIGLSYYQPQLPLQHGYINGDGYLRQNFGYDMTTQQEVHRGDSSSQTNSDTSSWGSFLGSGSTPHQFLPNSPLPSDSSRTQLNSAFHVQAQSQHRNDWFPIGTNYNFAALNNQPDPGAMSAIPEQQQGGSPRWLPLPSVGNNQHYDMPPTQQEVNQGDGSSLANGNASGWGSIQGTGSTSYQYSPISAHSPAPYNISWTSHDSTLQAQDEYRNDHHLLMFPGLATTPHDSFLGSLPVNDRNWLTGEASSPQYIYQGYPSWHHPGARVRPNHQQQSPYNMSACNLQDLSTMQPPRDLGP